MSTQNKAKNTGKIIFQMVLFAMFGALMFASKLVMEALPNIHLLGMFVMLLTIVFRVKALIPIYIYVMLNGIYAGFNAWWVPYLYVWTVLWAITMLIPKNPPKWLACVLYPLICACHGLLFGTLCAPAQALFFKLSFEQTVAWVMSGIPFDVIHALGNLAAGFLILPLSELVKKLMKQRQML